MCIRDSRGRDQTPRRRRCGGGHAPGTECQLLWKESGRADDLCTACLLYTSCFLLFAATSLLCLGIGFVITKDSVQPEEAIPGATLETETVTEDQIVINQEKVCLLYTSRCV